jgi:hypothetical protein
MTGVRKILLISLALILLSQIPFVYRRYRLRSLQAVIATLNSSRSIESSAEFVEYKGVIHVHSFLGGHSDGTFQEIISAAQANNLHFVVMTEHAENEIDTAKMTLSGTHGGVLFINGNEINTSNGERFLSIPGDGSLSKPTALSSAEVNANAHARGALSFVAYPAEFKSWNEGFDGIEVYNVFTNSKRINFPLAFFDALWSQRVYPALLFANYLERPTQSLNKWDELTARRRVVAIAGNDSHANVGFQLQDSSGKVLIGVQLDPYETSFRLVRVHVFVPSRGLADANAISSDALIGALRQGHCFIGFDLLGDTSGFRFEAVNSSGRKIQGDEIPFEPGTRLKVVLPVAGRIQLFRNGEILLDESAVKSKEVNLTEKGVYRVEVNLPQLGKLAGDAPWILSNPIYVR